MILQHSKIISNWIFYSTFMPPIPPVVGNLRLDLVTVLSRLFSMYGLLWPKAKGGLYHKKPSPLVIRQFLSIKEKV